MTDKELDDLFRQSFAEHQVPVPDDMWQRIQPEERKRRGAFWWWTGLGVASLFLLMGTAVWLSPALSDKDAKKAVPSLSSAKEKAATQAQPGTDIQQAEQLSEHNSEPNSEHNKVSETVQSSASPLIKQTEEKENQGRSFSGVDKRNTAANKSSSAALHIDNKAETKVPKSRKENTDERTSRVDEKRENKATITDGSKAATDESITSFIQNDSLPATVNNAGKHDTIVKQSIPDVAKKTHHSKAAGIELMAAGYGDKSNVYDAEKNAARGFVSLGAIDPKEKTRLYSISFSVRIDKPVTKNLSFKTGLQFLQTHQRITYNQKLVNQFAIVNSLSVNNDTMRFAQIQSERPVVKSVYNSISVPLLVSYHTNGSSINVGATAGVLVNLVSWYQGKVPDGDYQQTTAAKNTFRRNTGASLYTSLSAAKNWGNWQLFAEPHLQYTLSSLTKSETSFKQKITSYGIGIGIRKRIGR